MRKSWDEYFMAIAREAASRSTCPRKHVGAVLARDKTIIGTGYNGSVRGLPHCDDEGCVVEDHHCIRTVHAEANAIVAAARNGVQTWGSTLYTTAFPCWPCFKLVANAGIITIYYADNYVVNQYVIHNATRLGIQLLHLKEGF